MLDAVIVGAGPAGLSAAVNAKLHELNVITLEKEVSLENPKSIDCGMFWVVCIVVIVILISSLQSIALVGTVSIESILLVIIVATGLIVGTFTVGTRVIPPLIDRVAASEHHEILLLSVLGVCFGYALLANIVGLSVAIGAFLAGHDLRGQLRGSLHPRRRRSACPCRLGLCAQCRRLACAC